MRLFTQYMAIDIGSASIKAVQLEHTNGNAGYRPAALVCEPVPDGMIGGGFTNPVIGAIGKFRDLLRTVFSKIRHGRQGCIVGLPDRWVKLNLLDMTLKPGESELREFLEHRMKRDLKVPSGLDVAVDYQLLSTENIPEGASHRYLVGMVSRNLLDTLSEVLAELKIQVMAFDTSSLGVYNVFEGLHPENAIDRHIMMCHVGHETTVVKCFQNGILRYERVIEVAGAEFTRHCMDIHQYTIQDAEEHLKNAVFFPVDKAGILEMYPRRNDIARMFGNWLRELNVTFRFYQEKFKVQKLPRVYLTGGSSLFGGLTEFLSDYFGTPVERFNPLAELPGVGTLEPSVLALGPRYAPCIGLLVE